MGLPQREGRPALSIAPEDSIPDLGSSWDDVYTAGNPLNEPVKVRKGSAPENGWQTIASDTFSEGEDFGPGKGGEKR